MSAIEYSITLDDRDLKLIAELEGKAKFAAVRALTMTAKDSQKALKAEIGSVFHLRNGWVPQGIRIEAATMGSMTAKVGSIDKYMGRHVSGDDKPAAHALSIRSTRVNGRYAEGGLLIKPYPSIAAAPTHTRVRSILRRTDKQKRKSFQIVSGGSVLIVRRRSKKRDDLETLAILSNMAHDEPIWPFLPTVESVVSARFIENFAVALGAR